MDPITMAVIAGGLGAFNAFSKFKKEREAAKQHNKNINKQLDIEKGQRGQLGITASQAQDWATRQLAMARDQNELRAVEGMYNQKVGQQSQLFNDSMVRSAQLNASRVNKPGFWKAGYFADAVTETGLGAMSGYMSGKELERAKMEDDDIPPSPRMDDGFPPRPISELGPIEKKWGSYIAKESSPNPISEWGAIEKRLGSYIVGREAKPILKLGPIEKKWGSYQYSMEFPKPILEKNLESYIANEFSPSPISDILGKKLGSY